eukprot:TRINITY_DN67184_c15_g15_i1.p1 TRINITY_DN67184_c15_g15~~TRINITY_DN67184_c15_g15_i1.p1  ORF type:complete len:729 (-),score=313.09 TRINITY_DN67184_c15_g15_i1:43-1929(-)
MGGMASRAAPQTNGAAGHSESSKQRDDNNDSKRQEQQQAQQQHEEDGAAPIECCVCGEEVDKSTALACPKTPAQHSLCNECFVDYMEHCNRNYYDFKFPIKCSIYGCEYMPPERDIRRLLQAAKRNDVWDEYERCCVRAALMHQKDETPVTCSQCGIYTEIFPKDYKVRATRLLFAMRQHERYLKDHSKRVFEARAEYQKQVLDYLSERTTAKWAMTGFDFDEDDFENSVSVQFAEPLDATEVKQQERKIREEEEDVSAVTEAVNTAAAAAIIERYQRGADKDNDDDNDDMVNPHAIAKRFLDQQGMDGCHLVPAEDAATTTDKSSETLTSGNEEEDALLEELRLAIPEFKRQVSQVREFAPDKDPEINLTSQFFHCRTEHCNSSVCLRCNKFMKRDDELHHVCVLDEITQLYLLVVDTLSSAAAMKCPHCGKMGMKDLNCTHISCPCGGRTWCYGCGQVPPEGFSKHNSWTWKEPKGCPMYLKYKWGDGPLNLSSGRRNGSSFMAMQLFHCDLQMRRIQELKEKQISEAQRLVWDDMVATKFPNGIWDKKLVDLVMKIKSEGATCSQKWLEEQERIRQKKLRKEALHRERRLLELAASLGDPTHVTEEEHVEAEAEAAGDYLPGLFD